MSPAKTTAAAANAVRPADRSGTVRKGLALLEVLSNYPHGATAGQVVADSGYAFSTCYRLLTGWRGRPAADLDGLAEAIVAVSRLIASNNEIAELEINPVRVAESGALAVDALVVTDTTKE